MPTEYTRLQSADLIKPGDGERAKYSRRLHAFITRRRALPLHLVSVWRFDKTLYIGAMHGGDLIGLRLNSVLCGDYTTASYPFIRPDTATCVADFWPDYIALGRCYIDPEHTTHFIDERWDTQGDHRTCRWCGRQEQQESYEVTETHTRWVASLKPQ